jgi:hypothetical protein
MIETIIRIVQKHLKSGIDIYPPTALADIDLFERKNGFIIPADFREFYLISNGFACAEDFFNFIPLHKISSDTSNYGIDWFYFSEYRNYHDMWGVRIISLTQYEIFNGSYPERAITSSLKDFLTTFLTGGVFERGGLYEWQEELGTNG